MSGGLFISFEGTEGGGKSTQIDRLAERLRAVGREVVTLREPGGTPIGEEIRHLVKHSETNRAMTPETELLLICASRAQLVREVIRPALISGHVVLCDRFLDSTVAYQGHGRGLDLALVNAVNEVAVGPTRPDLTFWLHVPVDISERRRQERNAVGNGLRDRFEDAGRTFFEHVEQGFAAIAAAEPVRVIPIDATRAIADVGDAIWTVVETRLSH